MHIVQPSLRLATILLIPVITGLALAVRHRRLAARRGTERQTANESPSKPTPPVAGWHRRPLPPPAIALSSADGRTLAKAAISLGSMETFFALAEVFETQSEPAFCGLGTLVTALNALEVDPGELWKGPWRWYDAKMLDCCVDLDEIAERGLTFDEWVCLAKCQGLAVEATRASEASEQTFRQLVARECASAAGRILCVSYSRRPLGQTGDGHFSPVGGYHAASDSVLVLDVARFKHPPHWLPLPLLWQAMLLLDDATKRARGYATLARAAPPVSGGMDGGAVGSAIVLTFGRSRLAAAERYMRSQLPKMAAASATAAEELWHAARALPAQVASLVSLPAASSHQAAQGARAETHAAAVRAGLNPNPNPNPNSNPNPNPDPNPNHNPNPNQVRAGLQRSALLHQLARAAAQYGKRDGPLPLHIEACAALLLVLGGAVAAPQPCP